LCRAERPQRGRLREFFQWNIDIIGVDDCIADAETIFCALDYMQEIGLTPDDIVVKISSRKMLAEILQSIGIPRDELEPLYAVLDKRDRLPQEAFEEMLIKQVSDENKRRKIIELMAVESIGQISDCLELSATAKESVDELERLFELLDVMGVADFCMFDIGTVRGLAYYTDIPATGFGIGDCILGILLEEKGLLEKQLPSRKLDYFVACVDKVYREAAIKLTMKLRAAGFAANFSYKPLKLKKQLKDASDQNAGKCVIIGSEIEDDQLIVKNMATGEQELIKFDKFLQQCRIESK
jgi:histidyl-tRNA synthetase